MGMGSQAAERVIDALQYGALAAPAVVMTALVAEPALRQHELLGPGNEQKGSAEGGNGPLPQERR